MDVNSLIRMVLVLALLGAIVLYGSRLAARVASKA